MDRANVLIIFALVDLAVLGTSGLQPPKKKSTKPETWSHYKTIVTNTGLTVDGASFSQSP